jgi:hypothetical protein
MLDIALGVALGILIGSAPGVVMVVVIYLAGAYRWKSWKWFLE